MAVLLALAWLAEAAKPRAKSYFAGPARAGAGDCSAISDPCLIADWWAKATPGSTLYLLDGTYRGPSSMITPPSTVRGLPGQPITVAALHDGAADIDGESARNPLITRAGNDYLQFIGFNAHSSSGGVVLIGGNYSVLKRIVAWDANTTTNSHTIAINGTAHYGTAAGYGNLLEDVAAFGTGRYTFIHYETAGNTIRRCWLRHEGSKSNNGPHSALQLNYHSSGLVADNCIVRWDGRAGISSPYTVYSNGSIEKGYPHPGRCKGTGTTQADTSCLMSAYHEINADNLAGTQDPNSGISSGNVISGLLMVLSVTDKTALSHGYLDGKGGATVKDGFIYAPGVKNLISGANFTGWILSYDTIKSTATNITSIAPGRDALGSSWTVTNRLAGTSLSALSALGETLYSGTHGAHLRYQYKDGVLTTIPLWPWPMSKRILAATIQASTDGHNHAVEDPDAYIQAIFGTYPDVASMQTPTATFNATFTAAWIFSPAPTWIFSPTATWAAPPSLPDAPTEMPPLTNTPNLANLG